MIRGHLSRPRTLIVVVCALLAIGSPGLAASKKYGDLLKRLPETSNFVILVDIDALLDTPLAKTEKWRDRLVDRPGGPLGVSLDASRFVVASQLDFRSLEETWKLGMLQTKADPPKLSILANREGGYVEEFQTEKVVWTPRNFYLFTFEPNIIGFAVPANRQLIVHWIDKYLTRPREFAPGWLNKPLFKADAGTQIVAAADLNQLFSPREVEVWLRTIPGLTKAKLDPSLVAKALATVKSAYMTFDVDNSIQGALHIELDQDVSFAAPAVKEIVLTLADQAGLDLGDEMTSWKASVGPKSITLEGRLQTPALARILNLASAPQLTREYASTRDLPPPAADPNAPPAAPVEPTAQDVVQASQAYFHSIVDITDAIRQQRTQDYRRIRSWMDRSARQIDELPILFVDSDLLDWGAQVSKSLREMAYGINYVNKDRAYRLASSPKGSYVGYWGAGTYVGADDRVLKSESNAMLSVGIDGGWKQIEVSIGEMRRKMVDKYKVDF